MADLQRLLQDPSSRDCFCYVCPNCLVRAKVQYPEEFLQQARKAHGAWQRYLNRFFGKEKRRVLRSLEALEYRVFVAGFLVIRGKLQEKGNWDDLVRFEKS